jgi:hypothetical protein
MHRDEVKIFRGNVETHLLRIFCFARRPRALPPTAVAAPQIPETTRPVRPRDESVAPPDSSAVARAAEILASAVGRVSIPSLLLGMFLLYLEWEFVPDKLLERATPLLMPIALVLSGFIASLALHQALKERRK